MNVNYGLRTMTKVIGWTEKLVLTNSSDAPMIFQRCRILNGSGTTSAASTVTISTPSTNYIASFATLSGADYLTMDAIGRDIIDCDEQLVVTPSGGSGITSAHLLTLEIDYWGH